MKDRIALIFLNYIRFAAKIQLRKNNPIIIGVTGSAGKTSTKHAIAAALSDLPQLKVCDPVNSESGIPLDILDLNITTYAYLEWLKISILVPWKLITNWKKRSYYLVEMGIDSPDEPKNMSYLLKIIQPTVGVLLNAFPMHSQPFDYLVKERNKKKRQAKVTALIANEKGKLLTSLPPNGLAVFNADQSEIANIARTSVAKKRSFGFGKKADFYCSKYEYKNDSTIFYYVVKNSKRTHVTITMTQSLLPKHFATTFAAALAVGTHIIGDIHQVAHNIERHFTLPPGRSSLFAGINGSLIFDSSYNASREPMIDALQLLDKASKGRKIAILGDMRELGAESQLEHELVAYQVAKTLDQALLVGPEMKKYVLPILKKKKITTDWFPSAIAAATFLKPLLKKNDMVLVKGSQNTLFLESAVEQLLANKKDIARLCRRGSYWDEKRRQIPLSTHT